VARFSLLAHIAWEAVLLLSALVVTVLAVSDGHVFHGSMIWAQLAALGVLAAGLALSLRTGTPNLAVASIASLAGVFYAQRLADGGSTTPALIVTGLVALAVGVVLALVTGLTGAPAWAVTLGGVGLAGTVGLANGTTPKILASGPVSAGMFTVFAAVFVVGSIAGGLLWLVPGIRGALRTTTDDDRPAGLVRRLVAALVGLGGSSLLAGLAGVLDAGRVGAAVFNSTQLELLIALGAVLLGGVSLTGRGGGIAGTALAVYLLVVLNVLSVLKGAPVWAALYLPATLAILVGVLVSRLIDWTGTLGRRPVAEPPLESPVTVG
jgi:ribose/xylose/arabinose/galactoside ABC-type transport system permease subunit